MDAARVRVENEEARPRGRQWKKEQVRLRNLDQDPYVRIRGVDDLLGVEQF
jgi:hypothetical protein